MRFLIDAQLPPRLAASFLENGHQAEHISQVGLSEAKDIEIWRFAMREGATIVSKDQDFAMLAKTRVNGPSVVWIRVGNTSASHLDAILRSHLAEIVAALEAGERLLEIV